MIVIAEFMDADAVSLLKQRTETVYRPELAGILDARNGLLPGACALIVRNRVQVTEALLSAAPNLTCVGRLGVGLDNIDLAACKRRNIAVYPARGANARSVAEYVITATLLLLRGAGFVGTAMLRGDWPREAAIGREAEGKTIGLAGFGATGRETAKLAIRTGLKVRIFDPLQSVAEESDALRQLRDWKEFLATSDIVSLHAPLTADTRNLMGPQAIAAMKHGAILVNAARGGMVDENALCEALCTGHLSGAALDAFESEPLTATAASRFAGVPNLFLTPHIAGVTRESNARVSTMIAKAVLGHLSCDRQDSRV